MGLYGYALAKIYDFGTTILTTNPPRKVHLKNIDYE